jgi:hypothetical protein
LVCSIPFFVTIREDLFFLSLEEQTKLLQRVEQAQGEVKTAIMLFKVTDGQAGIDTKVLMPWHHLVSECWGIAQRFRINN